MIKLVWCIFIYIKRNFEKNWVKHTGVRLWSQNAWLLKAAESC